MTAVPRTPTATYRVQLEPGSGFAAAARDVPRLAALGVSHLHLSPLLEAVPGSRHGYDVTDHSRVRAELGGEQGLRQLAATARAHGLGLIADIVPNHMALPADTSLNAPLWRLLRDGPGSPAAAWFDLDPAAGEGRMTLPVLAGPAADERHALRVEDGALRYGDHHRFPLRPGTEHLPPDDLLDAQHYRLAWWRTARTELTYRRFFTVSELIAVRVEDPAVFEATHATVLRLLAEGILTGLRIDHPDGLADPEGYLRRLRRRAGPGVWVVAEKILGEDERLPAGWPVAGTTGYDALRRVDAALTDPAGAEQLTAHYRAYTGAPADLGGAWEPTVRRAAHRVIDRELAPERARLLRTARRLCGPEHPTAALRTALTALLVALPVYRPYVPAGRPPSAADTALLATAAATAARELAGPAERGALDALHDLALGRPPRTAPGPGHGHSADRADFRVRFAQVASALRAKAVEDCAGYRFTPLLSASEVGGDPGRPALPLAAFHAHCARVQRDWPLTGTVYTTHDTKRSGDVRAALAALTEHPRGWADLLTEVTERTARAGVPAPDPHAAWGCWQTAFALAPSPDPDRLAAAALKAAREAALHTTWTEPDTEYEAALERFVRGGPCAAPGYPVAALARELAPQLRANVLGAALLHLTMPGVPDLYRGSESVYRALVDPDNRRPAEPPPPVPDAPPPVPGAGPWDGLPAEKLWLTAVALRLRRARPEWFGEHATYTPLAAEGPTAEHALAFCRSDRVITVAARLTRTLAAAGGWEGTVLPLPPGRWYDALAGDAVAAGAPGEAPADGRPGHRGKTALARLLADRPVALLVRADGF
ncbi:malto-oligosyltrehalose synthase [Streptomyces carpaticus]|uniref:malto-oligosyltrehalose synthase n=1 Tax=Streptomyces carpaticus TaxID=285558 RepID=UPI0031F9232C